jgi:hypothetical protein
MLYATKHQKPLLNGYSGYFPPSWENRVTSAQTNFPSDQAVNDLKQQGITHLIIHLDEYANLNSNQLKSIQQYVADQKWQPEYTNESTVVYRLD